MPLLYTTGSTYGAGGLWGLFGSLGWGDTPVFVFRDNYTIYVAASTWSYMIPSDYSPRMAATTAGGVDPGGGDLVRVFKFLPGSGPLNATWAEDTGRRIGPPFTFNVSGSAYGSTCGASSSSPCWGMGLPQALMGRVEEGGAFVLYALFPTATALQGSIPGFVSPTEPMALWRVNADSPPPRVWARIATAAPNTALAGILFPPCAPGACATPLPSPSP